MKKGNSFNFVFLSVLIQLLLASNVAYASLDAKAEAEFEQANRYYREGSFEKAVEAYTDLTGQFPRSAVFFYNLGNALFRSGATGPSIVAFERAIHLDPRDRDSQQNLQFVRSLLEYKIEDKRNWYLRAGERVLEYFTEKEILFVLLLSLFLFLSSWTFCLFFRGGEPFGWFRKGLLVLVAVNLLLFGAKTVEMRVIRDAIVMTKEASVYYGPSRQDQVAFRLSEGLKLYVIDARSEWSRVLLVNGESGWIENRAIAQVTAPWTSKGGAA